MGRKKGKETRDGRKRIVEKVEREERKREERVGFFCDEKLSSGISERGSRSWDKDKGTNT